MHATVIFTLLKAITYFICFTIVLLPDSPAPEKKWQYLCKAVTKTPKHIYPRHIDEGSNQIFTPANLNPIRLIKSCIMKCDGCFRKQMKKHSFNWFQRQTFMLGMRRPYEVLFTLCSNGIWLVSCCMGCMWNNPAGKTWLFATRSVWLKYI